MLKFGQFREANNAIPDSSFEELMTRYHEQLSNHRLSQAKTTALKLTAQYGLKGLYVYVESEIASIKEDREKNEIIDQSVIQLLGLILFLIKNINENDKKWFEEKKQMCLKMIDPKIQKNIINEANALSEFYSSLTDTPGSAMSS